MFKLIIFIALVIVVYSCCLATGFSQPSGQSSLMQGGGQTQSTLPKKVRVTNNPNTNRVYHLLRNSVNPGDDDDMFIDEDNFQKRNFDDYGHMRFGKRQTGGRDFDDYGHSRFGKRGGGGGQTDDYGIGLRFGK